VAPAVASHRGSSLRDRPRRRGATYQEAERMKLPSHARASRALVALALLNCAPQVQAAATNAPPLTHEDYVQAEALLSKRIGALVLNERVTPHWLPGRDEFWYRRETASGHEFVIV